LSDDTISVVLTLANCTYSTGEYETAKRHMEGLCKIVKFRGGLTSFRGAFGEKLPMEMLRRVVDIASI
jgi:hypothetical protein